MNLKVTIAVPVYNAERFLERCIKSILNQSHSNLEVLLIDDGSTDGSPLICDRAQRTDGRVRVIHKQNGGVSETRNLAIREASGDYIQFVDADDYLEADMTESLVSGAHDGAVDMAVGGFKWHDPNTGKHTTHAYQRPLINIERDCFIRIYPALYSQGLATRAWVSLCRLDALRGAGVLFDVDLDYGEDAKFIVDAINAFDLFSVVTSSSYVYCDAREPNRVRLSHRAESDTYLRRRARHNERISIYAGRPEFASEVETLERQFVAGLLTSMPLRLAEVHDYQQFKAALEIVRGDELLLLHGHNALDKSNIGRMIACLHRTGSSRAIYLFARVALATRRRSRIPLRRRPSSSSSEGEI